MQNTANKTLKWEYALLFLIILIICQAYFLNNNKITIFGIAIYWLLSKRLSSKKEEIVGDYIRAVAEIINFEGRKSPDIKTLEAPRESIYIITAFQYFLSKSLFDQSRLFADYATDNLIFNIMPDSVLILDEQMNIAQINFEGIKNFGNVSGKKITDIINSNKLKQTIQMVSKNNITSILNLDLRKKIDRFFIAKILKVKKYKKTKTVESHILILLTDITKQKNCEDAYYEFLSNVNHEIKSPITSILCFSENIKEYDLSKELKNNFIEIIQQQCKRLDSLLSNALSLTKEEQFQLTNNKIDIKESINISIKEVSMLLHKNKMKINFIEEETNEPIKYTTIGNINSIISVFTNIISNSIKYGNRGSTITITLKQKIENKSKIWNVIDIADKSAGMEEEEIKKIMQRYYRAKSSKESKIDGHGLGLSIVKAALQSHNGHLKIKSIKNKGSNFIVYLPQQ